jgi:hypothetical protein
MVHYLTPYYYIDPIPSTYYQYSKVTFAVGLIIILAGIALHIYRKKYMKDAIAKKIVKKYPWKLEIYGAILLALLFFREQGIPYLSMRLLWVIWALAFAYTILKNALNYKKEYEKRSKVKNKNEAKKKYLPKKKK